jgi:hypothetical protein
VVVPLRLEVRKSHYFFRPLGGARRRFGFADGLCRAGRKPALTVNNLQGRSRAGLMTQTNAKRPSQVLFGKRLAKGV